MGIFSGSDTPSPPPPPPVPPAANPPTWASGEVQASGASARAKAAAAAGAGFGGTDVTKGGGTNATGTPQTAKAKLLGETAQ
jgi:hypothetical protein